MDLHVARAVCRASTVQWGEEGEGYVNVNVNIAASLSHREIYHLCVSVCVYVCLCVPYDQMSVCV